MIEVDPALPGATFTEAEYLEGVRLALRRWGGQGLEIAAALAKARDDALVEAAALFEGREARRVLALRRPR